MRKTRLAAVVLSALAAGLPTARAAGCSVTIGVVMSLTGPAGAYGQAGAEAVGMALRDFNDAGGATINGAPGCKLVTDTRDSQSQGTVAVDQATQLVDIKKVPVIIGGIISSVTIPILTSVTAPAGVVLVSPASSSPTLTALGREGKTDGLFFRTITSDALQGTAAAKFALDEGLKKVAIIYVNNAEVDKAMAGEPQALYLVSYPIDGATIARTWISDGGPRKFLLNDGMNSSDFIKAVGAQYLNDAYGTSSGTTETPSTKYFYDNFAAYSGGIKPDAPAADRSYDAGAIVALAVAKAGKADAAAIKQAIPEVVAPGGTPIYAGKAEFAKALKLIKEGKPIRYQGVIGPIEFDQYGDITGPFRLWRIQSGEVKTVGEMSAAEVSQIKSELAK